MPWPTPPESGGWPIPIWRPRGPPPQPIHKRVLNLLSPNPRLDVPLSLPVGRTPRIYTPQTGLAPHVSLSPSVFAPLLQDNTPTNSTPSPMPMEVAEVRQVADAVGPAGIAGMSGMGSPGSYNPDRSSGQTFGPVSPRRLERGGRSTWTKHSREESGHSLKRSGQSQWTHSRKGSGQSRISTLMEDSEPVTPDSQSLWQAADGIGEPRGSGSTTGPGQMSSGLPSSEGYTPEMLGFARSEPRHLIPRPMEPRPPFEPKQPPLQAQSTQPNITPVIMRMPSPHIPQSPRSPPVAYDPFARAPPDGSSQRTQDQFASMTMPEPQLPIARKTSRQSSRSTHSSRSDVDGYHQSVQTGTARVVKIRNGSADTGVEDQEKSPLGPVVQFRRTPEVIPPPPPPPPHKGLMSRLHVHATFLPPQKPPPTHPPPLAPKAPRLSLGDFKTPPLTSQMIFPMQMNSPRLSEAEIPRRSSLVDPKKPRRSIPGYETLEAGPSRGPPTHPLPEHSPSDTPSFDTAPTAPSPDDLDPDFGDFDDTPFSNLIPVDLAQDIGNPEDPSVPPIHASPTPSQQILSHHRSDLLHLLRLLHCLSLARELLYARNLVSLTLLSTCPFPPDVKRHWESRLDDWWLRSCGILNIARSRVKARLKGAQRDWEWAVSVMGGDVTSERKGLKRAWAEEDKPGWTTTLDGVTDLGGWKSMAPGLVRRQSSRKSSKRMSFEGFPRSQSAVARHRSLAEGRGGRSVDLTGKVRPRGVPKWVGEVVNECFGYDQVEEEVWRLEGEGRIPTGTWRRMYGQRAFGHHDRSSMTESVGDFGWVTRLSGLDGQQSRGTVERESRGEGVMGWWIMSQEEEDEARKHGAAQVEVDKAVARKRDSWRRGRIDGEGKRKRWSFIV